MKRRCADFTSGRWSSRFSSNSTGSMLIAETSSPIRLLRSSTRPGRDTDVSPRGDAPGFARVLDDHTIAIPDRLGNNRLDTMSNIVADAEVGLLFFIPGIDEALRINGTATRARPSRRRCRQRPGAAPDHFGYSAGSLSPLRQGVEAFTALAGRLSGRQTVLPFAGCMIVEHGNPAALSLVAVSENAATAVERPPTDGMVWPGSRHAGIRGRQGAQGSVRSARPRPKSSKTPVASMEEVGLPLIEDAPASTRSPKSQVFSKPLFGSRFYPNLHCRVHFSVFRGRSTNLPDHD